MPDFTGDMERERPRARALDTAPGADKTQDGDQAFHRGPVVPAGLKPTAELAAPVVSHWSEQGHAAPGVMPPAEQASAPMTKGEDDTTKKDDKKKPKRPYLDGDASQKLLSDAYGDVKAISKGKVEVLEQAAFQVAYDKIYGKTEYSWDAYIKPTVGNLEGFAHEGTNYINENMVSLDTVPHEMLHNNAAADWTAFVGSEFNEGTTEWLTIRAMKKAGKTPTHSYPEQEGVVRELIAAGLPADNLITAYLKGGAAKLIGAWVDEHCKGTWAEVLVAMEAKNFATAKAKLKKKNGTGDAKTVAKDAKTDEHGP